MAETTHNLSLEEMDKQSLLHPSTSFADHAKGTPRIVETGKGIFIKDSKGTELMDGFGGLYCVNIGYGRDEMAEAIYEQAKKLAYYHVYASHSNEPLIRLADRVVRMAPANMQKVYFGMSGSDANETNSKLLCRCSTTISICRSAPCSTPARRITTGALSPARPSASSASSSPPNSTP